MCRGGVCPIAIFFEQFLKFVMDVAVAGTGVGTVSVSSRANLLFAQAIATAAKARVAGKPSSGSETTLGGAAPATALNVQAFLTALRLLARQVRLLFDR